MPRSRQRPVGLPPLLMAWLGSGVPQELESEFDNRGLAAHVQPASGQDGGMTRMVGPRRERIVGRFKVRWRV